MDKVQFIINVETLTLKINTVMHISDYKTGV
jgi:hypothetical protein